MEKQDQLNALEAERLRIQARLRESDRAALDYVKTLPGFAEAYPEYAASAEEARQEEEANQESIIELLTDWEFHIGEPVVAGQEIVYNGKIYVVLQDHVLQADWRPDEVPALYRLKEDPTEEWPEWIQPTGASDAYKKGAKVSHNEKHWISDVDANVWEPGTTGTENLWHEAE